MGLIATEKQRLNNVVAYELGGQDYYSREVVTLLSGETADIGSVLGKITSGGKYALSDADASDGSEVASVVCLKNYGTVAADTAIVVLVRTSIVKRLGLVWHANNDAGEITIAEAELEAVGILVRDSQADYLFDV
jgi:hypothetical protein